MSNDANLLMYNRPASAWTQSLPLGNGNLGACVFGKTRRETICLNQDTIWSGYPRETVNPEAYDGWQKARELVMQGKYIDAQDEIEKHCLSVWSQEYIPFGDMIIDFKKTERVSEYRRDLQLDKAVASVSYSAGGVEYTREAFVSYPKNVFVMKLSASEKEQVSFKLKLTSPVNHKTSSIGEAFILDGVCPSDTPLDNNSFPGRGEIYPKEPELQGIHFRGAVTVKLSGGKATYSAKGIEVVGANSAIIFFACKTSYNGWDKLPTVDGAEYKESCLNTLFNGAKCSYSQLKKEHIDDYSKYYDRVKLNIGSDSREELPTNKRLIVHSKGKSDIGLYTLLYNFGRYLIISASREGSQPTNLQGIWNKEPHPPWNSNYTVNINTEMNYWPVLGCNLPELNMPLIDMIKELSVAGEKTAKVHYHARGFCVHHNVDAWRLTTPVSGKACWAFWPIAGGWFCDHVYNHYLYTNDVDYLKDTAYPIMKKAAEFFLDMLIEDKDGYLIMSPSTSPENTFEYKKKAVAVSETTTMTMSVIRQLFTNCVQAAGILGKRGAVEKEIKTALERILPIQVGSKGQILEWYKEMPESEPHHRHKSHLYGLHPAFLITPDGTPELADACRKSLELRGDNGTGWSLGWKINMWARLWDGDHALKMIDMQLSPVTDTVMKYVSNGGTYPNLFDAHPPFQIDGNYGYVSGINEMLMQSRDGKIYLLPALPTSWKTGSVNGLLAKGNITVDIKWLDGELKEYKLHGQADNVKVIYKGKQLN